INDMKTIVYTCFIFILLISTSCLKREKIAPILDLSKNKSITINQLSDSSFFCEATSIYHENDKYYISDYERNNIFVLDDQLNLTNTLGYKGKGPGELIGASHLFVKNLDSILIFNDGKRSVEFFNSEKHQSTISLPNSFEFDPDIRFCYENDNLYLSSFNGTHSILKYSTVSNDLSWFGDIKQFASLKETRIKNRRHLSLYDNNKIIAIPDCQPIIELYTLSGEKLAEYSIDTIPIINKMLSFVSKQKNEINSYYQFFQDIYVYEKNIFILILSVDQEDKITSNKIIQLEINNNQVMLKQLIHLGNGWYNKFCVTNNSIATFDAKTCHLIRYDYDYQ